MSTPQLIIELARGGGAPAETPRTNAIRAELERRAADQVVRMLNSTATAIEQSAGRLTSAIEAFNKTVVVIGERTEALTRALVRWTRILAVATAGLIIIGVVQVWVQWYASPKAATSAERSSTAVQEPSPQPAKKP